MRMPVQPASPALAGDICRFSAHPSRPLLVATVVSPRRFAGEPDEYSLATFAVDGRGTAREIASWPLGRGRWKAPRAVVHPSGRFVYVAQHGDGLTAFALSAAGGLSPRGRFPHVPDAIAEDVAVDPSGERLFVATRGDGFAAEVVTYRVDLATGAASAIASLPTVAMTEILVVPSGLFLFGTDREAEEPMVHAYHVDPGSGRLRHAGVQPTGWQPTALAFAGRHLYVAGQASNDIRAFDVAPGLEVLRPLGVVARVPAPRFLLVDPAAGLLHVLGGTWAWTFRRLTDGSLEPLHIADGSVLGLVPCIP